MQAADRSAVRGLLPAGQIAFSLYVEDFANLDRRPPRRPDHTKSRYRLCNTSLVGERVRLVS